MPFQLKHDEPVPEGIKRIAGEEIGRAIQHLNGKSGVSRDEAVHEARKCIKKVRALLRLVTPGISGLVALENRRLRDAGRRISGLRDAGALIPVFDGLKKHLKGKLGGRSLASIRRALLLHKHHLEEEVGNPESMRNLAATLVQIRQSVKRWPLQADGFSAIEGGLEQTFRAGRKALAQARKRGGREDFHEWRKRVKDHWYHVRLLEKLWSGAMQGYEHSLKELEHALGEDLNLAILRDRILAGPAAKATGQMRDLLLGAIDSAQKDLRQRALAIGDKIYATKPRKLTRRIRRLSEAWRHSSP